MQDIDFKSKPTGNNLHLLLLKTILGNMMKLVHDQQEVDKWIKNPIEVTYAQPNTRGGSRKIQYYRLKLYQNESVV